MKSSGVDANYKVLDKDLDVAGTSEALQPAIDLALSYNQYKDDPYYIENKSGDFIYLIYGGVVWSPTEAKVEFSTGRYLLVVNGVIVAIEGDTIRDPNIDGARWDKASLKQAANIINRF